MWLLLFREKKEEKNVNKNNILLNSKNNNTDIYKYNKLRPKPAENLKKFSETWRQIPKINFNFFYWFAGVIDGKGNFDIKINNNNKILKQIIIKVHKKDIKILMHIKNILHIGRININNNKIHCRYIISKENEMKYIINNINGLIRLKVLNFEEACKIYNIEFKKANYNIKLNNSYYAGLIDTVGKIDFNYKNNRIKCNLTLKYNYYSNKLKFKKIFFNNKYFIRKKKYLNKIIFYNILIKNSNNIQYICNYFMEYKLYSEKKFNKITKIKQYVNKELLRLKDKKKDIFRFFIK